MPKEESESETLAREVTAAHLGVRVERHDDGSLDSMPDAQIIHPDGRCGWLEVVTDGRGHYPAQQRALADLDALRVDDLRWCWLVHLRHDLKITGLHRWLPRLLRAVEEESGGDEHRAGRAARDRSDGRIAYAHPLPHMPAGSVKVRSAPFSHLVGSEELVDWLPSFLQHHHDVAEKMTRAGAADEYHAFVWCSPESGPPMYYLSAQRGTPFNPPPRHPRLPDGITHAWLVGSGASDRGIAWFPDRGWHELTTHWTDTPTGRTVMAGRARHYGDD